MADDPPSGKPARGNPVTAREQLPGAHRSTYDRIAETRGRVGGPFPVLLQSPPLAERVAALGEYLRFEGVLPDATRELAVLVTAREFDAPYEWAAHEPLARAAGVSAAAVAAVLADGDSALDDVPSAEALVVRYGRSLLREHVVPEETFASASERFGDRGVTELTATLGYYAMLACVLGAFGISPGAPTPID